VAVVCLVAAGCSLTAPADEHDDLRIMVPNAPGGGYDTTARLAAQVLEDSGLTERIEVFNLDGASGAVGLARMAKERGNPDLMMMMGLGVVGAVVTTEPTATFDDVTPVARLMSEPEIVVVSDDSPYRSLPDLIRDWRRRPRRVDVGGGSAPGGPDHLAPHLLADTLGIPVDDVDYTQYDGGGPLLAALLTGEVDFAVSGIAEYTDQIGRGPVRVLAVTSRDRLPGLDAPTVREQGVRFDFVNWRGLVAPPGLSAAQVAGLSRLASRMHDTEEWHRTAAAHGWSDSFLVGDRFRAFLAAENRRVARVLRDLGID
jgi:putative tricarboxylic transport membrane protein